MHVTKRHVILFLAATLCALVVQWSCNYDTLNFPTVVTEDAITDQVGLTVTFKGRINTEELENKGDLQKEGIGDFGFTWDTTALPLVDVHATWPVADFVPDPSGTYVTFETTITDFKFDESFSSYNVRAYMFLRGDEKYGRSVPFTFRTFLVANGGIEVNNSTVVIEGFLGITDTTNFQGVIDHGHVVSEFKDPVLTASGSDRTSFGARTEQGGYRSTFVLRYNTNYYARAYAVTINDTVYSRSSLFTINDGWNPVDPFKKSWTGGVAAEYGNSAVVGMGCNGLCGDENTVWKILPLTDSTLVQPKGPKFPTDEQRYLGSGFVIDDEFYFGLGFAPSIGAGVYKSDFFSYDLSTTNPVWKALQDTFPGGSRSDAVGVVLDGKAYVGLGENASKSFHDLWVFDPKSDPGEKWKQIKGDMPNPYEALAGASGVTAIAASDAIYFIGGKTGGSNYLNAVWRFRPPDEWTPMPDFRGDDDGKRANSVGFQIGNKLYAGLGRNKNKGEYYSDFFALDLDSGGSDVWEDIAQFPGIEREDAVAFVIDSIAYVGSGDRNGSLDDVWRYTPKTIE
jgi:Kelch motif